ncbi:MAG: hypothetical protein ACLR23_12925 [Clostridia bacterium]
MRNLTPDDITTLRSIVSVYKQYRQEFFQARIRPIGQMPDGVSFTGFQIECGPGHGYLLCFREFTANSHYTYALRDLQGHCLKATVLYSGLSESNRSASIQTDDDGMPSLTVTMKQPRSYMLIRLSGRRIGASTNMTFRQHPLHPGEQLEIRDFSPYVQEPASPTSLAADKWQLRDYTLLDGTPGRMLAVNALTKDTRHFSSHGMPPVIEIPSTWTDSTPSTLECPCWTGNPSFPALPVVLTLALDDERTFYQCGPGIWCSLWPHSGRNKTGKSLCSLKMRV